MPATVWKGYLRFGLGSFPIRLSAAARPKPLHFCLLHRKDRSLSADHAGSTTTSARLPYFWDSYLGNDRGLRDLYNVTVTQL
jgi:hypothetical protein